VRVQAARSHAKFKYSFRTSLSFVKKKAALTLLRLYRKHPHVIAAAEWALRIVTIMDDEDLVNVI
jgi:AP-2 complex subunit alpha